MTPGVITCGSCGSQAREGQHFCSTCARPLDAATPWPQHQRGVTPGFGYTDVWDTVLPRLQDALFGDFAISRELGRGGMAAVFLAHQIKLDRLVAIKVMAPTLMSEPGLVDRFRHEATTVARLDHPNIISIYEVGESSELQYFIMQYVAGRPLERALRQHGRLALNVTRAILFEVGIALAYAHRREVIHRDVKPGNILLSADGRVIVSDFGIAKVAQASTRTQTGAVVGTPAYMSPEQCWGKPLTWSADQYALGVVAYEMLAGTSPFRGTSFAVMRGHTEEPVPDLLTFRPECPPEVATAIARMLAKRPEDRFASMSEALRALGASRAAVDDEAQEAIGALAVPLPDEEGVVLAHTPVSPVPQRSADAPQPPQSEAPSSPGPPSPSARERFSRLAATARERGQTWRRWLAARWSRSATQVRAVALVALALVGRPPRSRQVIAGLAAVGLLITIGAVSILSQRRHAPAANATTPVVPERVAIPKVEPPADSTNVAAGLDSLRGATNPDSLPGVNNPDSLAAAIDSTAPSTISLTRVTDSRVVLTVGDSVRIGATVLDLRKQTVRGAKVSWSTSDTSVTVRSIAGQSAASVRGHTPGTATVTVNTNGGVSRSFRVEVNARPQQASVASQGTRRDTQADVPVADGAELNAVDATVTRFIDEVLNRRDVVRMRDLYEPKDSVARDAFIEGMRAKRNLTVRPASNPPPPSIRASEASAEVEITVKEKRTLRDKTEQFTLLVDLNRLGDGWHVTRYRVRPK